MAGQTLDMVMIGARSIIEGITHDFEASTTFRAAPMRLQTWPEIGLDVLGGSNDPLEPIKLAVVDRYRSIEKACREHR